MANANVLERIEAEWHLSRCVGTPALNNGMHRHLHVHTHSIREHFKIMSLAALAAELPERDEGWDAETQGVGRKLGPYPPKNLPRPIARKI